MNTVWTFLLLDYYSIFIHHDTQKRKKKELKSISLELAWWHVIYLCRFHDNAFEDNLKFVIKWVQSHIEDGDRELKKPIMFTEYGLSNLNRDFEPPQRFRFTKAILDIIYKSARKHRAGAGALIWQFFVEGMEQYNDDFGMVPWEEPSMYKLFTRQSCRLAALHDWILQSAVLKKLCLRKQWVIFCKTYHKWEVSDLCITGIESKWG